MNTQTIGRLKKTIYAINTEKTQLRKQVENLRQKCHNLEDLAKKKEEYFDNDVSDADLLQALQGTPYAQPNKQSPECTSSSSKSIKVSRDFISKKTHKKETLPKVPPKKRSHTDVQQKKDADLRRRRSSMRNRNERKTFFA